MMFMADPEVIVNMGMPVSVSGFALLQLCCPSSNSFEPTFSNPQKHSCLQTILNLSSIHITD
jgi:lactate/malate dehydrogenase, NAD binding domain